MAPQLQGVAELAAEAGMSVAAFQQLMASRGIGATTAYPRDAALAAARGRRGRRSGSPAELSLQRVNAAGIAPARCPACGQDEGRFGAPRPAAQLATDPESGDLQWECDCGELVTLKASYIKRRTSPRG